MRQRPGSELPESPGPIPCRAELNSSRDLHHQFPVSLAIAGDLRRGPVSTFEGALSERLKNDGEGSYTYRVIIGTYELEVGRKG